MGDPILPISMRCHRRATRRHNLFAALLLATLGAHLAWGADPDPVIERVASAFRGSSAAGLRPLLPAGRRVFLAVPAVQEREGFVGADQVYYLLRGFFEEHPTRSFDVLRASEPRASLRVSARWRYRQGAASDETVVLTFSLVEEKEGWVLTEMRAEGP